MATYIDALNGKHTDGLKQNKTLIEVTVINTEYFTFTMPLSTFNKYKTADDIVKKEFRLNSCKKISKDNYKVESTKIL